MKKAAQDLYRQYSTGELSGDALLAFEEQLKHDVVFREDFELYKGMESFVEERAKKGAALEVLRGVGRERGAEEDVGKKNKFGSTKLLIWLIPLLIIWTLGAWYANSKLQETRKHERMMAEYQYPPNRGTRSLEVASTKLDSAIHYFDLRRMAESEKLFLEILEQDSLHQDANRYMGHISFLKERDYSVSFSYLNKIRNLNKSDSLLIETLTN